ncbi:MAG: hypothetical protein AB8B69_10795 [Chitinophagales bacterium]
MLTTYVRRKFRQYAPILFFLQLFLCLAYIVFIIPSSSSNKKYVKHLRDNNHQNWERLDWQVFTFERRIKREKRGEKYLAGAKMFKDLAEKYRSQIKVLSDEATMITGTAFSDKSFSQKEKALVRTANKDNWKLKLHHIMLNYRTELYPIANYQGHVVDTTFVRKQKERLLSLSSFLEDASLNCKFGTQNEVFLALAMTDMVIINQAFAAIEHIMSYTVVGCNVFDKYKLVFAAESKVIYQGDSLKADVFLTKGASMARPTIAVDGEILQLNRDGVAKFKKRINKLGEHKIKASISVENELGNIDVYNEVYEYTVLPKCE